MTLAPFLTLASPASGIARMRRGEWSMSCPIGDLPKWLNFYRGLIARRPASAPFYAPCITSIEAAMTRAGMPIPPVAAAPSQRTRK